MRADHQAIFFVLLILGVANCAVGTEVARPVDNGPANRTPPIVVLPQSGDNLAFEEQISSNCLIVRLASPAHNWFSGTFTNLPTDTKTVIGFSLAGNDNINKATVAKWASLAPVMTYANPGRYQTYEWFSKDAQGRWVSGDPFKTGQVKFAGTHETPLQGMIPEKIATQFLSADGKYWSPWREVDAVEANQQLNTFRITHRFVLPSATVAMRIPYTPTYLRWFTQRLHAAKLPGVFVDTIGNSPQRHPLCVIRMEPPIPSPQTVHLPTVLVYAREHATEPDGSWAIEGMINWLLSHDAGALAVRNKVKWLFIPILDSDRAARSEFYVGDFFQAVPPIAPEALDYARYLIRRIDLGEQVDVVLNLHNLECTEGPNLCCPFKSMTRQDAVVQCNRQIFTSVQAAGFTVGEPEGWSTGMQAARFAGWCNARFRTFDLTFEVNTRAPQARLNLPQIHKLGATIAEATANFLTSKDFVPIHREITAHLLARQKACQAWDDKPGHNRNNRTPFETLSLGY
jgi:hypothetical protein